MLVGAESDSAVLVSAKSDSVLGHTRTVKGGVFDSYLRVVREYLRENAGSFSKTILACQSRTKVGSMHENAPTSRDTAPLTVQTQGSPRFTCKKVGLAKHKNQIKPSFILYRVR